MKRRTFLLGSAGVLLVAGLALKPTDEGDGYDSYFGNLNEMLKRLKVGRPAMLIDVARLKTNSLTLINRINDISRNYRIVSKSLPSLELIKQVREYTGSNRIMTFQQPFMNTIVDDMPDADLLLGKPMPIEAVERFYQQMNPAFNPQTQLQWLIDTPDRLKQYLALAKQLSTKMRINIEIDVGLHRGGLTDPKQLNAIMDIIHANEELSFSGFMGYDGHVGKLPSFIESTEQSLEKSIADYQGFIDYLFEQWPQYATQTDLTFNGSGSPTVMLHDRQTPLTELSAGSCLVKPTDFDVPSLGEFEPAAFIATPVLKEWTGLKIPGPLPLGSLWQLWDVNRKRTFFIYGGYWKAKPEAPKGLAENSLYGYSSNQMMYNGSPSVTLKVGDYLFLRPTQSEAVLLDFGDLLANQSNELVAWWPPFSQQHAH